MLLQSSILFIFSTCKAPRFNYLEQYWRRHFQHCIQFGERVFSTLCSSLALHIYARITRRACVRCHSCAYAHIPEWRLSDGTIFHIRLAMAMRTGRAPCVIRHIWTMHYMRTNEFVENKILIMQCISVSVPCCIKGSTVLGIRWRRSLYSY